MQDRYTHTINCSLFGYDVIIDPESPSNEWYLSLTKKPNKNTMTKYYKVLKDNFLWEEGAILKPTESGEGYIPVDDIFKKHDDNEYISKKIIEESPEYFERVYKVNLATRVVYETKDKAKELIQGQYKE